MERLDRVAPSRKLAQIAAVMGREFSYDLLSAASQIDDDEMLSALSLLDRLTSSIELGISPVLRFAFKHALLWDAIYDCSLLRSKRQQIHADIAAILEHDFSELGENQPQVLAYHYQEAGNPPIGHSSLARVWAGCARPFRQRRSGLLSFRKSLQLLDALPVNACNGSNKRSTFNWRWEYRLSPFKGMPPRKPAKRFCGLVPYACNSATIPEDFQALFVRWGHSWMGGKNDDALPLADEFLSRSRALSPTRAPNGGLIE